MYSTTHEQNHTYYTSSYMIKVSKWHIIHKGYNEPKNIKLIANTNVHLSSKTTDLHMSNLVLFPLVLLHLVFQQFHTSADKRVVVTTIVLQLPLIHVYHICAHTIKEILKYMFIVYNLCC